MFCIEIILISTYEVDVSVLFDIFVFQVRQYKSKASHYIGWLLQHQGRGSICYCLKERGFITSIETFCTTHCTMFAQFSCTLNLTDQGMFYKSSFPKPISSIMATNHLNDLHFSFSLRLFLLETSPKSPSSGPIRS